MATGISLPGQWARLEAECEATVMWPQTATWATRVTCLREPDYVPLPGGAEEQQGRAPQVDMLGTMGCVGGRLSSQHQGWA